MNIKLSSLIGLSAVLALAACSNKQIYDGISQGNKNDCAKEPPGLYEQCIEKNQSIL